jgi:hypothetical protein
MNVGSLVLVKPCRLSTMFLCTIKVALANTTPAHTAVAIQSMIPSRRRLVCAIYTPSAIYTKHVAGRAEGPEVVDARYCTELASFQGAPRAMQSHPKWTPSPPRWTLLLLCQKTNSSGENATQL